MKAQKSFFIIAILICLALSLAATLATYSFYDIDLHILDTENRYRGWPLYWIIESIPLWDYWPSASRAALYYFQPLNFLGDIVFWAIIFQLPSILILLTTTKKQNATPNSSKCKH